MAGALVNIRLVSNCGSGHGHIEVTINGGSTIAFTKYVSELSDPFSIDERDTTLTGLLRLLKIGRTNAQLATLLSGAGLTLDIGSS